MCSVKLGRWGCPGLWPAVWHRRPEGVRDGTGRESILERPDEVLGCWGRFSAIFFSFFLFFVLTISKECSRWSSLKSWILELN